MDPNQLLIDADQAISDLEYDRAQQLLNSYASWRFVDGFEPQCAWLGTGPECLGDRVAEGLQSKLNDRKLEGA